MNEVYIDMRKENEWIRKHFDKDLVSIEELLDKIEDLDSDVEYWKEKYGDLIKDLRDNYKPIPYKDQIGVNDYE